MKTLKQTYQYLCMSIVLCLLGSCASEQVVSLSKVERDAFGRSLNYSVGEDEDGNPVVKSEKRSALEGKKSNLGSRSDFSGSDYTTKAYRKKRWGGKEEFSTDAYSGVNQATQYDKEPWFVKKQANAQGAAANESKQTFFTKLFKTSKARESNIANVARVSDAETDLRRRVYKEPEIFQPGEYRSNLGIEDTKRMLFR